ncbi:hypothetical protein [Streptomyces sp. NPDC007856]|uniref:hypothetical protein n=1 Tax=Streptomyces sp. NPDC007856 TaxID=3364781 RepID=UPI0036B2C1FE
MSLVDVLALEALRVRYPAAHDLLPASVDLLTGTSTIYQRNNGQTPREKAFVEDFTLLLDGHAQSVIRLLFPAAERLFGGSNYGSDWVPAWERDRRVACRRVLDFYLHRQLPAGRAPIRCIESVAGAIGDESALTEALGQVPDPMLDDVLKRLVPYLRDVSEEQVLPTAKALMRQLPRIRLGSTGMLSPGGEWAVLSPVRALLRTLGEDAVEPIVRSLFHSITSFYGRALLLSVVSGGSDDQGVITEDAAQSLRGISSPNFTRRVPGTLPAKGCCCKRSSWRRQVQMILPPLSRGPIPGSSRACWKARRRLCTARRWAAWRCGRKSGSPGIRW